MPASDSILCSLSQIDFGNPRFDRGLRGHAVENFLAVVQHDHAIDDPHQYTHDVLDPDDRDVHAAADTFEQSRGALDFRSTKTTETFVGEQKARPGGKGPRQFELLQSSRTEAARRRRRMARQYDQIEGFLRTLPGFGAREAAAAAVIGGERNISTRESFVKGRGI